MPWLQKRQRQALVSRMVKICGVGESQVEDMLLDLIHSQTNPTIATYAKTAQVDLRLTARGNDKRRRRLLSPRCFER